ncbi:hypothetical protein [uncultured Algibacter sp.]|uniref:hypothetical protein n=1 Tax=uncultured Algibacter sp. TaxID=298659 RepID=UPI0026046C74|nr:hypothetical protein [uncultured Algibacter sp.]
MKKLQLLLIAMVLMVSVQVNATDNPINTQFNLNNPDVRKCLIEASKSEGWKLEAYYINSNEKLVLVFGKDGETKVYAAK